VLSPLMINGEMTARAEINEEKDRHAGVQENVEWKVRRSDGGRGHVSVLCSDWVPRQEDLRPRMVHIREVLCGSRLFSYRINILVQHY
jgi:hypothetical protein